MRTSGWLRTFFSGVAWALAYNLLWGLAWFTFMRREWLVATAAAGSLPWAVIWVVWLVLSIALGVAVMAFIGRTASTQGWFVAVVGALAVWLPLTLGMAVVAWQSSLPARIAVLDSLVNLVALVVASLTGQWLERVARRWQRPA